MLDTSSPDAVDLAFATSTDTSAPTSDRCGGGCEPFGKIDVSWTASTDNVGVVGYNVFRDGNGTAIANVTGTSYQDSGLAPGSTHTYTVSALDAVPNESAQSSPPAVATTVATASTTFVSAADSYVDSSSPSSNFGTSTAMRVDATPTVRSYLRFNVSGLTGTVTNATLRVFANHGPDPRL